MTFSVEVELEVDGRWVAEVIGMPGALAYGRSKQEAQARVQALCLRVVADQLDQG
ncbi:MAG TPA: type II toxin-antitoxin system HicB family antitoxin [Candidatus Polarisedimenticolia bacterium]|jgi:predicted RNase H-like HicB family nuclease